MKSAIFAVALLTVGCFSLPLFAQQQDLQEVMNAANALSARESELLSKKDAAGIASLFTSDGLLVMLAPQFAFKPGRDAIQKHYQGIIDAGATSITLELKNLELRGNDGVWAAGNYSVTVKDKTIQGNWFRILKRENGTWKIAMEAFARAGAIDAPPAATGSSPPPQTANKQRFIVQSEWAGRNRDNVADCCRRSKIILVRHVATCSGTIRFHGSSKKLKTQDKRERDYCLRVARTSASLTWSGDG